MSEKKAEFIVLLKAYLEDADMDVSQLSALESALEDPENIQLLEELMDADLDNAFLEHNYTKQETPLDSFSKSEHERADLRKVLERIAIQTHTLSNTDNSHQRTGYSFKRWGSWAAAIIILGLSVGLINKYWNPAAPVELAITGKQEVRPIVPGSKGAVLTLADGKQILLDSSQQASIKIGGTILQFGAGQINYTNNKKGVERKIEYNLVTTSRGRQFQLQLADGSKVWLNASSSLRFPSAFDATHRTVELTGEAYFEVVHNAARPFQVKVKDQFIEDIGTHFNINAYEDGLAKVKTTLLEGIVKVSEGQNNIQLKPGQQTQMIHGQFSVKKVNVKDVIAWKSGYFQFSRSSVQEVLQQISRWYDVDVEFSSGLERTDNSGQLFSGKIDRSLPLKDLLDGLQFSRIHFKIDYNNRKIIVKP